MKQINDYRSQLVHGDPQAAKKAVFTSDDGTVYSALELAARLLGASISVVLDDPAYLKSGAIEARLLGRVD